MKKLAIIILLIFSFINPSFAFEKEAEILVQQTTDTAKKIVKNNNLKLEDKKKQIEKIALEVVDVDGLGRFCLGAEKQNLKKNQLDLYEKTFRTFFSKNISSRLQNYSDQNINIIGSTKISDNYVMVNSKMISIKENKEVAVDWRVFNIGGKLLIRDLVVEGLSLAKTQREEFSSILANKGFDGLITNLNDFILKN